MLPYEGGKAGEFFAYNMNSENDFWSTFFGAKQCFYGCYTWYTIYDEFILNDHFYRKNWGVYGYPTGNRRNEYSHSEL